ncbi:cation/H+ exchanger 3 [Medicago truncatula]|uniref:Cation/H+ exchanger 3 n=1 Tax=Medicago truncatula TaxID=3880 RepID=G7IIC2_MEDTR|nr:cation/H+ exchanger 3 [Medicago truncatula]
MEDEETRSTKLEVAMIKPCRVGCKLDVSIIMCILLLAGPGVVLSTIFLGTLLKLTFPYGWSWKTSLLLGGLLGASDPVAVVALLKELGASKKLSTIIEGESVMNDGYFV